MKHSILGLGAAAVLLASTPTRAESVQISAGAACQPATAADVAKLDYSIGSARNVFTAPGDASQVASVVCVLPTVAPGHVMVRATVYLHSPSGRWPRAKCAFYNVAPGVPVQWATIIPLRTAPMLGTATIDVDPFEIVPHSVNCSVHPGQSLYGLETAVVPIG